MAQQFLDLTGLRAFWDHAKAFYDGRYCRLFYGSQTQYQSDYDAGKIPVNSLVVISDGTTATIYIQLEGSLKKLSSELTKAQISAVLGYTPSNFSGSFTDLTNNPFTVNSTTVSTAKNFSAANLTATTEVTAGSHKLTEKATTTQLDTVKSNLETADTGLSNRIAALEAINHDAYKAADTSLKTTIETAYKAADTALETAYKAADTTTLSSAKSYTDTKVSALSSTVGTNTAAINTLNGTGTGSVKATVDAAITKFATDVTDNGTIDKFKELVDYVADHDGEFTTLLGTVGGHTTNINTLNSDVNTLKGTVATLTSGNSGSIANQISTAINGLDVDSVGGSGKYITTISQSNGKISATAATFPSIPTVYDWAKAANKPSYTASEVGAVPTSGTSSITTTITTTGSITAAAFYQSSDERLKTFYDPIKVDLEKLKALRKNYFKFNDRDRIEIGVSAQEVQEIYPELVMKDRNGYLRVAYDKLSVVALSAIDQLEDRLTKVEKLLEQLIMEKEA